MMRHPSEFLSVVWISAADDLRLENNHDLFPTVVNPPRIRKTQPCNKYNRDGLRAGEHCDGGDHAAGL
jgi:hypothetical protein